MSDQGPELEPLSALASAAFAAERRRPLQGSSSAAERERIASKILLSVGVGAATGVAAGKVGIGVGKGTSVLSYKVAALTVAAFALGGGTGAALYATTHTPSAAERSAAPASSGEGATLGASHEEPEAPIAASAPPSVSASVTPSVSVAPAALPAPASSAARAPAGADGDLSTEKALIERARTALARGDTQASLEATRAHQTRYPRGRLTEERELIAIQALARSGQTDAAHARAASFRRRYPQSVFLPVIDRIAPP